MYLFKIDSYQFLFRRKHPATLGLLRIAFGILMTWQFPSIQEYILFLVKDSKFFLTYDFFHWVKPVSYETMQTLFVIGYISAIALLLGFMHRIASVLVFLIWTYIFLLCRGHYTNHYYLFAIVAFWLSVSDANRWASIDLLLYKYLPFTRSWILGFGEDKTTVPYWQIFIFKIQLAIVYFYGGLAKFSWDWFQGYPMRMWLPKKPWLPDIMKTEFVAIFMSWTGMLFDVLIGFVLLSKYRKWGIPFVLSFHLLNEFTFRTIGGFPHFMAASTMVFFDPYWPQALIDWFKNGFKKAKTSAGHVADVVQPILIKGKQKLFLGFFLSYLTWQILFPFRHFLYPGDPSLTGEGSCFAWRMMLTSRDFGLKMKIKVNNETFYITNYAWLSYINERQFTRLGRMPKTLHRFAIYLRDEMRKTDPNLEPEINGFLIVKYNGRPYRHMVDTTVNLAATPYKQLGHSEYLQGMYMDDPPGERYKEEIEIFGGF